MRFSKSMALFAAIFMVAGAVAGQPASPRGKAATQLGGEYEGRSYSGGKWIEIDYSRPILRGRTNIFGSGDSYGQGVNAGAPVWRAGANQSTRLKTEADLLIGGHRLPAGEYSVFVELKEGGWTFIVSNHKAQETFDRNNTEAIWGSYGYKPEMDVLRAPMEVVQHSVSVDQFTINFVDVTKTEGKIALWWENTVATVPFSLAE